MHILDNACLNCADEHWTWNNYYIKLEDEGTNSVFNQMESETNADRDDSSTAWQPKHKHETADSLILVHGCVDVFDGGTF